MNLDKLKMNTRGGMRPAFAVFVLAIILFAVATLAGCPQSTPLHKALVAADSIGSALNSAAQINHEDTLETVADRAALASYIDGLAKLNDAFVAQLKTAEANNGQVTAAQIVSAFNALNTQAQSLQQQGLLHLKSASAQSQFNSVTATIQTLLTTIQALLPAVSSHNRLPGHGAPLALCVLALTPEEITALLALLIPLGEQAVTLVEKLTAMKSETDAQLQADALSQDAQAEAVAEADEAAGSTS
jgi:hypothetical protein